MAVETLVLVGLIAVHLFASSVLRLSHLPRSAWLSVAGGISVAYVFVHIFPQLAVAQASLEEAAGGILAGLEHHAYLAALLGLGIFYGLERLVRLQTRGEDDGPEEGATSRAGPGIVADSIILNVLKEELPAERQGRFLPFAAAGIVFAALLVVA